MRKRTKARQLHSDSGSVVQQSPTRLFSGEAVQQSAVHEPASPAAASQGFNIANISAEQAPQATDSVASTVQTKPSDTDDNILQRDLEEGEQAVESGSESAISLGGQKTYAESFKKKTAHWIGLRGDYLTTIDNFLEAADRSPHPDNAPEGKEAAYAQRRERNLRHALNACDLWLEKHHIEGDGSNAKSRKRVVLSLRDELRADLGIIATRSIDHKSFKKDTARFLPLRPVYLEKIDQCLKAASEAEYRDEKVEQWEQALELCDDALSEILRQLMSREKIRESQRSTLTNYHRGLSELYQMLQSNLQIEAEGDIVDEPGKKAAAEPGMIASALGFTAGVVEGMVLDFWNSPRREKIDTVMDYGGTVLNTTGTAARSGLNAVGGGVGDIVGGSTQALTAIGLEINSIRNLLTNTDASQSDRLLRKTGETVANVGSAAVGATKVGLGAAKLATPVLQNAGAGAAAASGLGIVTGSISILTNSALLLKEGYSIYKLSKRDGNIQEARKNNAQKLAAMKEKIQAAEEKLAEAHSQLEALNPSEIPEDKKEELLAGLDELEDIAAQYEETEAGGQALENMSNINRRAKGQHKVKAAQKGAGAAGGAAQVAISGAGLAAAAASWGAGAAAIPIVSVSATALTTLGVQGTGAASWLQGKYADYKYDSLTSIATRIGDDGTPKSAPDEDLSKIQRDNRLRNCYYKHMLHVLTSDCPDGLSSSQFTAVKEYEWSDKLNRQLGKKRTILDEPAEASQRSNDQLQNSWVRVQKGEKVTHKEKPRKRSTERISYEMTPSARKSANSAKASREVVVQNLLMLCKSTGSPSGFVEKPVKVTDENQAEISAKDITVRDIMSAAGIASDLWNTWLFSLVSKNLEDAEADAYIAGKIDNHLKKL